MPTVAAATGLDGSPAVALAWFGVAVDVSCLRLKMMLTHSDIIQLPYYRLQKLCLCFSYRRFHVIRTL